MKKVFFVLVTSLIFGLSSTNSFSQASVDPPEYEFRWKQRVCPYTGDTYEICWMTGDGFICSSYGQTTRPC